MSETPAPPEEATLRRVPTGIEGLDIIVQGGFFEGGITIIQGKPGVGKTILANQLCFNHAAGRRSGVVCYAAGRDACANVAAYRQSRLLQQRRHP